MARAGWTVVVMMFSGIALADPSEGVPFFYPYSLATRDLRVSPTDGGAREEHPFTITRRGPAARALLLYVSEVRTAGPVTLRFEGLSSVATTVVAQPGWHEWEFPPPLVQERFWIETASADVTLRFEHFDYGYDFPSQRHSLGALEDKWGQACTGVLRLAATAPSPSCPAPNDDLVAGNPYFDATLTPPGTHQQRMRVNTDWYAVRNPLVIQRWFALNAPMRLIGVDGGRQGPGDAGYFVHAVTGMTDGGMSDPFFIEFDSDGGNLWAVRSDPPDPCHPVARAGLDGEESRWVGGPVGSDLSFRIAPDTTWPYYLDLDRDGFPGRAFEWRAYQESPWSTDCDDADPSAQPGAPERCNGRDDDCDGTVDGPNLVIARCERIAGICGGSWHVRSDCQNGAWLSCESRGRYPAAFTPEEVRCDGVDEDCDGRADDGAIPVSCPLTRGVCSGALTERCVGGAWAACEYGPHYELTEVTCDGLDNDCDGLTDGADLDVVSPSCELQQGVCSGALAPRAACSAVGWSACGREDYGPQYELREARCDGLDNDCDGLVDAADSDLGEVLCENQIGVCAGLKHLPGDCQVDQWRPCATTRLPSTWQAVESRCDGLDNDCDGVIDERCAQSPAPQSPRPDTPSGCTCSSAGVLEGAALLALLGLRRRRARGF